MAWSDEVGLMAMVGYLDGETGVLHPFRFIASRAPVSQVMTAQDAVDSPQRGQGVNLLLFEFPEDSLGATEQALVVETEAGQFDDLLNLPGRALWR